MSSLLFKQLFESESSTFTYILADLETKEAVLIDSVIETVARDVKLIQELDLKLLYLLETHVHADHITGSSEITKTFPGAKKVVADVYGMKCTDVAAKDGTEIKFGRYTIRTIATPGHTVGCLSFYMEHEGGQMVFTGDSLLIRGCGRTDFQNGSSEDLFASVQKIFALPESTVVYPAHDYKGHTSSSVCEEKKWNPRLGNGKALAEFVAIMSSLVLPQPKKIQASVPANWRDEIVDEIEALYTEKKNKKNLYLGLP